MSHILNILPTITFFCLYKFFDIFIATIGIATISACIATFTYIKYKTISKLTLFNTSLIIIMSCFTLFLQDSSFFKMKPTIIYSIAASFIILDIIFLKKYYVYRLYLPILKHYNDDINRYTSKTWKTLSMHWVFILSIIACANEYIWRLHGEEAWVIFKVFFIPIIFIIIIFSHIRLLLSRYKS